MAHRTDWDRLDVGDPATGRLLTARDRDGFCGAFHGELRVSPDGRWIADDSRSGSGVDHGAGISRS